MLLHGSMFQPVVYDDIFHWRVCVFYSGYLWCQIWTTFQYHSCVLISSQTLMTMTLILPSDTQQIYCIDYLIVTAFALCTNCCLSVLTICSALNVMWSIGCEKIFLELFSCLQHL